jgi:DNA-binding GntR family transcriptional regulator
MNLELLDPLAPRTLKENVTEILRQSIIDGTLAPGAEFNQAQIAERLGISRGPIREALGQLEQEGLIESTPYKGVMVTQLTHRYVSELYSVRASLETLALERFMERITDDDLATLHDIVAKMRLAAKAEQLGQLTELDLAFHEYFMRAADHQLAYRLWKVLEVGVRRCLHLRHHIYTFLDEVVGSHPTLVTAIEAGDKVKAVDLLYHHIVESAAHILDNLPPDDPAPFAEPANLHRVAGNGVGVNSMTVQREQAKSELVAGD